jgi:integrase
MPAVEPGHYAREGSAGTATLRPERRYIASASAGSGRRSPTRRRVEPLAAPAHAKDQDPKSEAGKRTIAIPPHVMLVLRLHLEQYAGPERLFVSRDGSPLRSNTLYQAFVRARREVGLDQLTFHDLRHTGATLAAQTGATLADLMKRLGHSSMAAARRYMHAVDGRDREIAKALSRLASHGDAARLPKRTIG